MKTLQIVQLITRHIWFAAFVAALVVTSILVRPQAARAEQLTAPPVPDNIAVPPGNELYFVGHAVGTQNYICLPTDTGVAYKLFTPQANLYDSKDKQKQITTHYFSPNPFENGKVRATWQDSVGTSTVWGEVKPGNASTDPNFVEQGAIAWLLVTVVGAQDGPNGGDMLSDTTFIQRLDTSGGVAPATGCAATTDIGNQAFVPYTTDYYFYRSN